MMEEGLTEDSIYSVVDMSKKTRKPSVRIKRSRNSVRRPPPPPPPPYVGPTIPEKSAELLKELHSPPPPPPYIGPTTSEKSAELLEELHAPPPPPPYTGPTAPEKSAKLLEELHDVLNIKKKTRPPKPVPYHVYILSKTKEEIEIITGSAELITESAELERALNENDASNDSNSDSPHNVDDDK